MILDKFGKLLGNPNSGTQCIISHNLAPVKTAPGEILIVALPLTGVAHRQKEKTGLAVNSVARLELVMKSKKHRLRNPRGLKNFEVPTGLET
jgi:hypothetical protein